MLETIHQRGLDVCIAMCLPFPRLRYSVVPTVETLNRCGDDSTKVGRLTSPVWVVCKRDRTLLAATSRSPTANFRREQDPNQIAAEILRFHQLHWDPQFAETSHKCLHWSFRGTASRHHDPHNTSHMIHFTLPAMMWDRINICSQIASSIPARYITTMR